MVRILVADDHELVRAGIRLLLEGATDMEIVAEAADGMAAVSEFKRTRPDVVVLDISMPVLDGLDTCKQLKALFPESRILVLSVHPEEQYAARMMGAGASGYVNKTINSDELQNAIRTVAQGGVYLSQAIKGKLLAELIHSNPRSDILKDLSDRESQIFMFLARGKRMKEIASELGLSPKTVDNYRARILEKLNLSRTVDLVAFAYHHHLV